MTGRTVPEWIGSTPDAKVPDRVRLRVFRDHCGRCAISGRKIGPSDAWDLDHEIPLALGGEHRESNLQPVLREAHRTKTAGDVAAKAKADRRAAKHLGLRQSKRPLPGSRQSGWKRKMDGTWERRG